MSNNVPFVKKSLISKDAYDFFKYTVFAYLELVNKNKSFSLKPHIVNSSSYSSLPIEKIYLKPTDDALLNPKKTLTGIDYVFKEMVYHSQNGGYKIRYGKYEKQLEKYLCGYDYGTFSKSFKSRTDSYELRRMKKMFLNINKGILDNFYDTLKSIIGFLDSFGGSSNIRKNIIDHFSIHKINGRFKCNKLFTDFKNKVPNGFGEALVFDFLKEFDPIFDLPKPDLHIKRTMIALFDNNRKYVSKATDLDCISIELLKGPNSVMNVFLDLMDMVNTEFKKQAGSQYKPIPNYALDKMVYLICSGRLYLQNAPKRDLSFKQNYISDVVNRNFVSASKISVTDILSLL